MGLVPACLLGKFGGVDGVPVVAHGHVEMVAGRVADRKDGDGVSGGGWPV